MKRVAITGMGIISPVGNTCDDFIINLIAGRSGIRRISSDFDDRLSIRIAAQADFSAEEHFTKKMPVRWTG